MLPSQPNWVVIGSMMTRPPQEGGSHGQSPQAKTVSKSGALAVVSGSAGDAIPEDGPTISQGGRLRSTPTRDLHREV